MTTLVPKTLYGMAIAIILLTAYFGWPTEVDIVAFALGIVGYRIEHK